MAKKSTTKAIIPIERIEDRILLIRDHKVMIDADLADLYHVPTKVLNQAVKRNQDRFPDDFMFQLTKDEKDQVVTNCDHLSRLRFSPTLPFVFTEHGAIMLSSVLSSSVAVQASISVVRAFVRLREVLASNKDMARKLMQLERKYDTQFKTVFAAIRQLMEPPPMRGMKKIGFGE